MGNEHPRWRVFVSHTRELREYPQGGSYVAEVERAISAAGHVIVDMRDLPAADQPAAQICVERVQACDVYVGLLGTRYGPPVRDMPELSYTELEFNTATEARKDRLIFILDTDADDLGIPPSQLIDREFGDQQDAFRARVKDSGLTTLSFDSPSRLGQLVERSLRDLAETRRRLESGLKREHAPGEQQPVRGSKFVNPPPAVAPTWFQGRQLEIELLAQHFSDPAIRLITVVGPAGVGKTAMVCRLLKGLEEGRIPGVNASRGRVSVGGIVYLSSTSIHTVTYPKLVGALLQLLAPQEAQRLLGLYQAPDTTPAAVMQAVLKAFPPGDPVIAMLDNLDQVMDPELGTLKEAALNEALTTLLSAPPHRVTVVATTRVPLAALSDVTPAAQRRLLLDKGLAQEDARSVLRELDDDGSLGLRSAPDDLLDELSQLARGVPRALEAIKAILNTNSALTPQDLLDRTRDLPETQVLEKLVREAYGTLDPAGQQVTQALSVFPAPVPAVAVDFLLQPYNPTVFSTPILDRLANQQLVQFHEGRYSLQPVDRTYVLDNIPAGQVGDTSPAFTFQALRARAVEYYLAVQGPRLGGEERTWLIHDQPAVTDQLGRRALAGEIAALLERLVHDDDRPEAFAIHLDAPWGAGKSTLVGFIVEELNATPASWVSVRVDAWRSSQLSPAWWALLSHIRAGVRSSLHPVRRVIFDIRLFGHEAVRLWRYWVPLLMFIGVLLLLDAAVGTIDIFASAKEISAVIALVVTIGAIGSRFLSLGSMQGARVHERMNDNPMDQVARQFQWIRSRAREPVLLILDDIDRCSSAFTVELLDAVQTLLRNSHDEPRTTNAPAPLVVLAVGDHRWLEAAYDEAYNLFSTYVSEPGRPLGRLFLDKLFQLNVDLPKITDQQMSVYLSKLLGRSETEPISEEVALLDNEMAMTAETSDREIVSDLQNEVRTLVGRPDGEESVDEGVARITGRAFDLLRGPEFEEVLDFALRLRRSDPARAHRERHLLENYADLLDPNPRSAKRFLMAYSVNYAARLAEGGDFDSQTLALWTLLTIRWPALTNWVRQQLPALSLQVVDQDGHPSQLLLDEQVDRVIQSTKGGPLDRHKVLRCCGYRVSSRAISRRPSNQG